MIFGINKELPAIAIMTAVGYISCYLFQFGILSYYGIPFDLASVDINSLLFSMFTVSIFSIVIIIPVIVFSRDWESKKVRQVAFSYMFLILGGVSYYIGSLFLGYYSHYVDDKYTIMVIMTTFALLTFIVVSVSIAIHLFRKGNIFPISNDKIITKTILYILVIGPSILTPILMGFLYANVSMAASFYKKTDYFFVLENSKGIIVASCDNRGGVSFKRVKSDEADFNVNYNPMMKSTVKTCFDKWNYNKLNNFGV